VRDVHHMVPLVHLALLRPAWVHRRQVRVLERLLVLVSIVNGYTKGEGGTLETHGCSHRSPAIQDVSKTTWHCHNNEYNGLFPLVCGPSDMTLISIPFMNMETNAFTTIMFWSQYTVQLSNPRSYHIYRILNRSLLQRLPDPSSNSSSVGKFLPCNVENINNCDVALSVRVNRHCSPLLPVVSSPRGQICTAHIPLHPVLEPRNAPRCQPSRPLVFKKS
jgi:hypothetical protein